MQIVIPTQVVTFLLSLLVPGMGDFQQTHPALFVVIPGIAFSTGVFLIGWLALNFHWLASTPKYPIGLIATMLGAFLPLIVALILYLTLEPGNPFFFISMLTGVLGFHIPGWIDAKPNHKTTSHYMGLFDRFKRADYKPEDQRLFGRWVLERSERDLDTGERVMAEFTPDGRLDYSINKGVKTGIMKMVYRVEDGILVTDQPSP